MRWIRGAAAAMTALGTMAAIIAPMPAQADDDGPAAVASWQASPATPGAADPTWTVTLGVPPGRPGDGVMLVLPTQWRGAAAFGLPSAIPAADVQLDGRAAASVRVLPFGGPGDDDRERGEDDDRGAGAVLAEGSFSVVVVSGALQRHMGALTLTISGPSGVQNPPAPGAYPVLAAELGPGGPHWVGVTAVIGPGTPTPPPPGRATSALTLSAPATAWLGNAVGLSAQVSPTVSDGAVVFYAGGLPVGTCVPGAGGSCGIAWTPAATGAYTLTAIWSGDAALLGSQAGPFTVSVETTSTPSPPSGSVGGGAPGWAGVGLTLIASPPHIGYAEFCGAASGCLETFVGSTSTLVAAVVGSGGQPVSGQAVTFSLSGSTAGSLSAAQCVTGMDGTCAVVLDAGTPSGTATYLVQAAGAGGIATTAVVYGGA